MGWLLSSQVWKFRLRSREPASARTRDVAGSELLKLCQPMPFVGAVQCSRSCALLLGDLVVSASFEFEAPPLQKSVKSSSSNLVVRAV